jgi:hypothetical protein
MHHLYPDQVVLVVRVEVLQEPVHLRVLILLD